MRRGIILSIAGLAFLAGCGNQENGTGIPVQPKWKGAPYRIAFDTKGSKPNADPATLPPVKYTANPEALEQRAVLVVKFDVPGAAEKGMQMNRMITAPVDVKGEEGTLPADYMDRASKDLANYLAGYCLDGKVTLSVALARSSLNPQAGDGEVEAKRLSDWVPSQMVLKKTHKKC